MNDAWKTADSMMMEAALHRKIQSIHFVLLHI